MILARFYFIGQLGFLKGCRNHRGYLIDAVRARHMFVHKEQVQSSGYKNCLP